MAMHFKRSISILILILSNLSVVFGQKNIPPQKPRLVVVITVEGLSPELAHQYQDQMGTNGLRRLLQNSASCTNARLGYRHQESLPGLASLVSGAYPSGHGIIANEWYNRNSGQMVEYLADKKEKSTGPGALSGSYSPRSFPLSTIGDELNVYSNDSSKVIAIAQNPQEAVLLANHAGDAAYFFDPVSGNWVSNSWYMNDLPEWVHHFNNQNFKQIYLEKEWIPDFISGKKTFSHQVAKLSDKPEVYSGIFESPYGFTFTKDFFLDCILSENLGRDRFTDILFVHLSPFKNVAGRFGNRSDEFIDLLFEFDKELEHFLNFIDTELGKENVLLVFANSSYQIPESDFLKKYRIPQGEFDVDKAMVLLRAYLNALYGPGEWFLNYSNFMVYLNRDLIEDAHLELDKVQEKVASFLMELSGVEFAVPAHQLFLTNYSEGFLRDLARSYHPKHCGDVLIQLQSGWRQTQRRNTEAISKVSQPAILVFYGWKTRRQNLTTETGLEDIAPTLSKMLGLPFSNGNQGKVLEEIRLTD